MTVPVTTNLLLKNSLLTKILIRGQKAAAVGTKRSAIRTREAAQQNKRASRRQKPGEFMDLLPPRASDDNRFLVFAEDAAEGVGDFADGGVGFDRGEDGGKEIFSGGGAALELGEGGLGAGGVAFGAQGVQAGNLGALDFGVYAKSGDGAF